MDGVRLHSIDGCDSLKPRSSSSLVSMKSGKSVSGTSFIKKLFLRQSGTCSAVIEELENQEDDYFSHLTLDSSFEGIVISPNPCIHPLGQKLIARVEISAYVPRVTSRQMLAAPNLRNRRVSTLRTCQSSVADADECADTSSQISLYGSTDPPDLGDLRAHEDIAAAASLDVTHLKHWDSYIKCYAEGRYNAISPPSPPPKNPSFTYLPAIYASSETSRLSALKLCNDEWSKWARDRARDLVRDAMDLFNTPWAAISFIDKDFEIAKAELGYGRQFIRRSESIGAHVLLTQDVMAINDTSQDWRFSGNPLVVGGPKIRFYAGAPLLSAEGDVIGVFAIFSPEPREQFTFMQRRQLASFSAKAVMDLTALFDKSHDDEGRSTPILQRNDLINRISYDNSKRVPAGNVDGLGSCLIPPALRCQKTPLLNKSTSRVFLKRMSPDMLSNPSIFTPPNSDDSEEDSSPLRFKGNGKNNKQLSVISYVDNSPSSHVLTPVSSVFHPSSPLQFSSSDLITFDQNDQQLALAKQCSSNDANTLALEAENFTDISSTLSQRSTGHPSSNHHVDVETTKSSPQGLGIVSPHGNQIVDLSWDHAQIITSKTSRSKINSMTFKIPLPQSSSQVAADFAAAYVARKLDFDCVYCVEIVPRAPLMTDNELRAEGGMHIRILSQWGLPNDAKLDIGIHISAIRTKGIMCWEDKGCQSGECAKGFMLSLKSWGGPRKSRSHGVLFCAFKQAPVSEEKLKDLTQNEFNTLARTAIAMKHLIFNDTKGSTHASNSPISSNADISTAYPANEAVEVTDSSIADKRTHGSGLKRPENFLK